MIEQRFHRTLYRGEAVDEAVKVFAGYATFDLVEATSFWVVRITVAGDDPALVAARERRLAGEFRNYALGLTVKGLPVKAGLA